MDKSLFIVTVPAEKPISDEKVIEDFKKRHSIEEKHLFKDKVGAKKEYHEIHPFTKLKEHEDGTMTLMLDIESVVLNAIEPFAGSSLTIHRDYPENKIEIMFSQSDQTEVALHRLQSIGVGNAFGSIHIVPLTVSMSAGGEMRKDKPSTDSESSFDFAKSVKSRMIVQQVVEQTKAQASFSFDFVLLTIVASILAAAGLATNNAVIIVASMLVSPLMGPILAVCFGLVIENFNMAKTALISELKALGICVVVGFVFGLFFSPFGQESGWPEQEMSQRGEWSGLLIGIIIAFPSGVGVALSVLGNNTNSLVGVAISASLLPPAVNTGLLWAYALYAVMFSVDSIHEMRMLELGVVSFLLTALNIVLVISGALVMFRIKEVAPIPHKSDLWKHYIPEVRKQKTIKGPQAEKYKSMLQDLGVIKKTPMADLELGHYNYAQSVSDLLIAQRIARANRGLSQGYMGSVRNQDVQILPETGVQTPSPLMGLFDQQEDQR